MIPLCQETRSYSGSTTTVHACSGGSFDLYFIGGQNDDGASSALATISQTQPGCIGLPTMEIYNVQSGHSPRKSTTTEYKLHTLSSDCRCLPNSDLHDVYYSDVSR
ncbi:hypothetical protein K505DRAFT_76219 [Melanomma pulvis-pyrius CBS 109.77]|uniref:Uncharacterized protein n=1 Tax=Melanomma pulvis-pyrius CBS 109.77 TaxID=1314802 RepID=A0A6A6X3J8_9PLEO|nr:hypothetical protein K505DRAFT_76219 [Melanomma pulvis-pyrius CBS 109.77]